jgi:predicted permease
MLQIGLSLVLLIGAGLFARSLRNLRTTDLGLARGNLLLMNVRTAEKSPDPRQHFWMGLSGRLSGLSGVRDVALAGDAVFGNGGWNQTVWIGRPGQPALDARVSDNLVSPGFFATVGIPLLKGREFGEQDREDSPRVAVVNQTFARRFFGNDDPVGKHFGNRGEASSGQYEIVGVVGDAKYGSVREQPRPMVFYSMWQEPPRSSCVVHVRTAFESPQLTAAISREIEAAGRDVLISDVRALPQVVRTQLLQDRMLAELAGFFALLALALGAVGIYGILAYRVSLRTIEIGIRMALGAQRGNVLWLVMRETLVLLFAGTAVGVPSALMAARLVKVQLFALSPSDPITITTASVVLFVAGALAGYLPARRAASVEPMWALRSD